MSDSLYRQTILSHYHAPKNYGLRKKFDVAARGENRLCGDSITVHVSFAKGAIKEISFESAGCVISRASASLLFEAVRGKKKAEVRTIAPSLVKEFFGPSLTSARIPCALLSLETIQKIV